MQITERLRFLGRTGHWSIGRVLSLRILGLWILGLFGGDYRWQFFALRNELDRYAVDAVTGVLLGHLFTVENVPKVPTAILAGDLDSLSVGVNFSMNRTFDFVVESRPTATAVELVVGLVKRVVASLANVGAFDEVIGVFTGESVLGAFVEQNPTLFRC